jgi:hypothetical protein
MALDNAGCRVDAVCPARHPIQKTSVGQTHLYRGLAPLKSLADAISAVGPDLIIPSDDLAVWHLHRLHHRQQRHTGKRSSISELIERSLGDPANYAVLRARARVIAVAHQEGVLAPETQIIRDMDDLKAWISESGFPVVLKADGSSGGTGVKVVQSFEQAKLAFQRLQSPPSLTQVARKALSDEDRTLGWSSLLRERTVVNAQTFILGREATSTIACWNGEVLASHHFEVLDKQYFAGPATVLRLIDNPKISAAAERMVRRLKLSGVIGFDFILEANSGDPNLVEINPRATQVGHLALGSGRDIPAAIYSVLTGELIQPAPKVTEKNTICLFPEAWIKNPMSAFLRSAHHDVPWEEPELVSACLRDARKHIPESLQSESFRLFPAVRQTPTE